jgi:hypothetical protein
MGLGPFLVALPRTGKVGASVKILGTNLTGATSVRFNGVVAAYAVSASGSFISVKVPAGATTGAVRVTTASGPLATYAPFQVIP